MKNTKPNRDITAEILKEIKPIIREHHCRYCNMVGSDDPLVRMRCERDVKMLTLVVKGAIQQALTKQKEEIVKSYEGRERRYKKIFRWLQGYSDFPERKEGDGAYWWRKELRQKLDKLK